MTYGRGQKNKRSRGNGGKRCGNSRQLVQLLLCLAVFLVVFIGKGVWPSKVAQTGERVLAVIRSNTDFRAAFAGLGQALSQQESVLGELGEFCVSVFAPVREESGLSEDSMPVQEQAAQPTQTEQEVEEMPVEDGQPQQMEQMVLQVGDVLREVDDSGQELPEGYNAQWLYLGGMKTVTPVQGTITSHFGYRDHPTVGRYAAHGGVDIAANKGTPVAAFAAGTVEIVGENDDFGLYLQLSHPNGVSTFYSHCSEICVNKGEEVRVGQTVALVGSTGKSTGPHLHFEVRLNGVRLDPMYYIELEQVV